MAKNWQLVLFVTWQTPTAFSDPNRHEGVHWHPLAQNPSRFNDWGGVHTNSGVGNKLCYLLTDGDTFNGHTIFGMGIDTTARLFYECQTSGLLTSGADYADLGGVLLQAANNLDLSQPEKDNVKEACQAVEILPGNVAPILSMLRVEPPSGTEVRTFEFLVYYYDPDGDDYPLNKKVLISGGREGEMTLKSGSAANGTYHYTRTLPQGSYSYMFLFADQDGLSELTNWQSGPNVYATGKVPIDIVIQSPDIACDLRLKYSLDGISGPWTDIPIIDDILDPIAVPSGSEVTFNAYSTSPNHEFREWEVYENHSLTSYGPTNIWSIQLGTLTTEISMHVYYRCTHQNYTIGGTVLHVDSSPVPGGVDLTLTSSHQTMTQHSTDGNFSFTGVTGGTSVTVTPSADGYAFRPSTLSFPCLQDDQTGQTIQAYPADSYAPTISFISVPPTASEDSNVTFTWIGDDDVTTTANLLYKYRLEGVDVDWSTWDSGTTKPYDLENGVYTFWVTAKDEAGNENMAPINYKFVVNAAPKVISAVRTNKSVWASRITLEMPVSPSRPTDSFVLLPEHAAMNDPELVPVTIHNIGDITPSGASELVATELGIAELMTQTSTGYLVTLPDSIASGQSVQYDIIWGKIKHFGWQAHVSVPNGFPNGGDIADSYLDEDLNMWRIATKLDNHGTGSTNDDDGWVFMDVCSQYGMVKDETVLRFVRGESWGGTNGTRTKYRQAHILNAGANTTCLWEDYRYEYIAPTNYNKKRYGLQAFDAGLEIINSSDGSYENQIYLRVPTQSIQDKIWIIDYDYTTQDGTPSVHFTALNSMGNEVIPRTVMDTITGKVSAGYDVREPMPIAGNNVILLWARTWDTPDNYRSQLVYQIRDPAGSLVKSTAILSGPLYPDSVEEDDDYYYENMLTDKEGKVWVSYIRNRSDQPKEYYYVIMGSNGDIWKGPIPTTSIRTFNFCDKDGYIWATEEGQFFVLNPDDTAAAPPRTAAWIPTQDVGFIAASAASSGYRLYDRWSPQIIEIDIPAEGQPTSMNLFDLNMWGNDLHVDDVNLSKGVASLWNHAGQFTGQATVDITGMLGEGQNILTMTQTDFLGGQVLITFPYHCPLSDFNDDCQVDITDYAIFAAAWMTTPITLQWNSDCDISRPLDSVINEMDLSVFGDEWLSRVAPERHTIIITSTVGGHVTSPGEGQFAYIPPRVVPLEAIADAGFDFVHWTGTAVDAGRVTDPNSNTPNLIIDGDNHNYTLQANFIPTAPIGQDLIAHWNFDEGSGDIAYDSSGNGHHDQLNSSPTWVPRGDGFALQFDGNDDWISISDENGLLGGVKFDLLTVEAWIQTTSKPTNERAAIFWDETKDGEFSLSIDTDGHLTGIFAQNPGSVMLIGPDVTDGEPHVVTLVKNSSQVALLVDGTTVDSAAPIALHARPAQRVAIGRKAAEDAAHQLYYTGLIDDVKVYGTPFSE